MVLLVEPGVVVEVEVEVLLWLVVLVDVWLVEVLEDVEVDV